MSNIFRLISGYSTVGLLVAVSAMSGWPMSAGAGIQSEVDDSPSALEEEPLQFAFESTPWRDVIDWLADSAGLALHVGDLPTGSFTYTDPGEFTPQEAINRVNLFLQPEGFTLVRSDRLLSVVNLADRRSAKQLDSLARLVSVEDLDELDDYDLVKCIFPLGELEAEDAVEELSSLNLITTPAVFPRTNQILIVDVAVKLRSARQVLSSFEPTTLDNGTVVESFSLQHVTAEDVLMVARPHLGLATGEMIGIDVSLSADVEGKNIFVTGIEDKVRVIEGLVKAIDQPVPDTVSSNQSAVLKSHSVDGGNLEVVNSVLQTLLAGEEVRLSSDERAGAIVALATPEIQARIAQTVAELQAADDDFAVIQLQYVDPYFAISLLEQMLDLSESTEESTRFEWWDPRRFSRQTEAEDKPPRIDADPGNMRLFVSGKPHEIEQIRKIIEGLDVPDGGMPGEEKSLRLIPLTGRAAENAVYTAARFWEEPNPIFWYPLSPESNEPAERVVVEESIESLLQVARPAGHLEPGELLNRAADTDAEAIRCQQTARGLLIQCSDTDSLNEFERLLRMVSGPGNDSTATPVVFYLKYVKANDAIRMLAELLDGGSAADDDEAGTLVNGYVSSEFDSLLGSLVTSRDGMMTLIDGTMTVLADTRLNRLITQGTVADIDRLEGYLKIVDKDNSLTSVETYGTSQVIELSYSRAAEVAAVIRDAYTGRVAGGSGAAGQGKNPAGGANPQQAAALAAAARAEGNNNEKKNNGKKGNEPTPAKQPDRSLEPQMTIAVHEPSNSLIVTAPEQLFKEVRQLAMEIDLRSKRSVEIIQVPDGVDLEALQRIFTGGVQVNSGVAAEPKAAIKK